MSEVRRAERLTVETMAFLSSSASFVYMSCEYWVFAVEFQKLGAFIVSESESRVKAASLAFCTGRKVNLSFNVESTM